MKTPNEAAKAAAIPVLPLRAGVVLPGRQATIPVGRESSLELVRGLTTEALVVLAVQKSREIEEPTLADLHPVAVLARVLSKSERGRGMLLRVEPLARVTLGDVEQTEPFLRAAVDTATEARGDDPEAKLLTESLKALLGELVPTEIGLGAALDDAASAGRIGDLIVAFLDPPDERKVEVLIELDVVERLRKVTQLVHEARAHAELKEKIDTEVRRGLEEMQRKGLLRQQLSAIRKELGEDAEERDDDLRAKLDANDFPPDVRKVVEREWARLDAMPEQQAEANVIRTYLEWMADLPWSARVEERPDLYAVEKTLDEDHYGLDDVKRRILEHMAVLRLAEKPRGTILCLAGPPGVGKTSLAQSVARAIGRPLERVSLGGTRDEAEIRGHRRTYIGALPGRIIHAMRKAGVKNPVIVLDEVDKLSQGFSGDPEAALLEVLDPEQNDTFTDHYIEQPFDLSEVLFIATANDISSISPPLRDRLEIIEVRGYTEEEKLEIARRHLLPKALERHGLAKTPFDISDRALAEIVESYTREAGVRQLTRRIEQLCRARAVEVGRAPDALTTTRIFEEDELRALLGKPVHRPEAKDVIRKPGVAAGLAWTPVGGDVLYVETLRMPGKGGVVITGQLGDVMKESVQAALSFVRSEADRLGVDPKFLAEQDLHVHVPAGAVPKDGPSAGVTMFTAITSLLTGQRVRQDTAMTGEATLRGRVLPVGGIKEKVLAAHRAGMKRVILPKLNEPDLEDLPESVRTSLELILAEDMEEVIAAALEPRICGPHRSHGSRDAAVAA
jgi:ATP-dependent Lon protease